MSRYQTTVYFEASKERADEILDAIIELVLEMSDDNNVSAWSDNAEEDDE